MHITFSKTPCLGTKYVIIAQWQSGGDVNMVINQFLLVNL